MELSQFEGLITAALSADNKARNEAVTTFQKCRENPDMFFSYLVQLMMHSQRMDVRQFCAVMMRQNLNPHSPLKMWSKTSPNVRDTVKQSLLSLLEGEQNGMMRRKVSDTIAMLGSNVLADQTGASGQWPELLPLLLNVAKSPQAGHREAVFQIFGRLAEFVMDAMRPQLAVVKALVSEGLVDKNSSEVRVMATKAWYSLLLGLNKQERDLFTDTTPLVFQSLNEYLQANDDDHIQETLEVIVDAAQYLPTFFRPHIEPVIGSMLQLAGASQLESASRRMAMSFLLNLVEKGKGMVRKVDSFAESIIPLAFQFLLVITDDAEWDEGETEDYMEMEDFPIGLEAVDRLAFALGAKKFMAVSVPIINELLQSQDWHGRHAGLMALSEMAEGCKKNLESELEDVVGLIIPHINDDPVPRCRWAALNALAQVATDFSPAFQQRFHTICMPALIQAMDLQNHPRVVRHAALCLVDFCAGIEPSHLIQYSDQAMMSAIAMLNVSNLKTQEAALSAVAAVAAVMSERFGKYYDAFMPGVMNILINARDLEHRELRGRAMECVGLMGAAVGKERFGNDAERVMEILVSTQQELTADDPQFGYMVQACARICQCLGRAFQPYLQYVVPPLIEIAANQDGCFLEDEQTEKSMENEEGYESVPMEIRGVGVKKLVFNTAILEEKSQACSVLYEYAKEMGSDFMPYVKPSANILVPLMRFPFNEKVRVASVAALPALIKCAAEAGEVGVSDPQTVVDLWNFAYEPYIDCIEKEGSLESLDGILVSLSESIDNLSFPIPLAQQQQLAQLMGQLMSEGVQRRQQRVESMNHPDFDEEDYETVMEENAAEDEFLGYVAYVIKSVVKNVGDPFFQVFQASGLENMYWAFIQPSQCAGERTAALCIICDMIECCPSAQQKYPSAFFPFAMDYSQDEDVDVRQSALFALGVCAQFGGEAFREACEPALQRILHVIRMPNAREDDNEPATDNAISSLGKICHYHAGSVDQASLLSTWLAYLPMSADEEEAQSVHRQLCFFVENSNEHILGKDNSNIPRIVQIFGDVIASDLVTEETRERMINIWSQMQQSISEEALGHLWNSLSEKQQYNLLPHTPLAQQQQQ